MRRFLASVTIWFACTGCALAQGRIDCSLLDSRILKRPVRYCVQVPSSYEKKDAARPPSRYPVLYFLHGLNDDEQSFFKTGGWTLIEDLRQRGSIGDFLIVAPEGRNSFYINSADGKVRYSDFFLREFIPYIEKKYRVVPDRAGRAVSGISMGGYGALRLGFANPQLFGSVSAQSAALLSESPEGVEGAAKSQSPVVRALAQVFGDPVDVAHWRANDPFVLAKRNKAALKKSAIYFNCGQSDDYGFEKGAAALDQQLTAEGIAHQYRPYPGDHSLNYFLSHLAEVMEFHSREFAAAK
jgi:S-formylglutathione hydrolase FrmB